GGAVDPGQPSSASAWRLEIRRVRPALGRHCRPLRRRLAAAPRRAAAIHRGGRPRRARSGHTTPRATTGRAGVVTRIRDNAGRLALLALLGLGIAAAWRWRSLFDPAGLTGLVEHSPVAPVAFLAVHVIASLLFVPRTLLAV